MIGLLFVPETWNNKIYSTFFNALKFKNYTLVVNCGRTFLQQILTTLAKYSDKHSGDRTEMFFQRYVKVITGRYDRELSTCFFQLYKNRKAWNVDHVDHLMILIAACNMMRRDILASSLSDHADDMMIDVFGRHLFFLREMPSLQFHKRQSFLHGLLTDEVLEKIHKHFTIKR